MVQCTQDVVRLRLLQRRVRPHTFRVASLRIRNARIMRSHNDPPLRPVDEHVRDVSCHPMTAVGIGYTIAFSGLNHSHLAEDAYHGVIHYVFESMGSAASDRR